nr:TetR/AcrR family transcriptional regulator [Sphingomonas lenta]
MDTARKLFIANGFHATGIAQIARESGIAVGQIYRDFASKEEIVAALVEVDCGAYMDGETLDAAIRAGDAESVRTWLHHFVEPDEDLEEGRLFAEIVAESSRNERIAAIFTTLQDRLKAKIVSAIALLAPGEGLAERRGALADLITALSLGLLHYRLLRPTVDAGALAQALREVIDRELAALR